MSPTLMTAVAAALIAAPFGATEVGATADAADPEAERVDWAATVFAGRFLDNDFDELINPADVNTEEAGLIGVAIARKIAEPIEGLELEIEGQIVRHFGAQDHWELNAPVVARWTAFPWDETVDTSAAFGLGLSVASEEPTLEREIEGETAPVLAYWMAELEAGPAGSDWSVVGRIHHRSTAFGVFGDEGGSNSLVLGLRRRF